MPALLSKGIRLFSRALAAGAIGRPDDDGRKSRPTPRMQFFAKSVREWYQLSKTRGVPLREILRAHIHSSRTSSCASSSSSDSCSVAAAPSVTEAEYQGRQVTLNKPFRIDDPDKKFGVYVRDRATGRVKFLKFGARGMQIKRHIPERRASFRARHRCDSDPPEKDTARYWSCRNW